MKQDIKELLKFIQSSPSMFHVIDNVKQELLQAGFCEVFERDIWKLELGQKYYVVRNDSSLLAFQLPTNMPKGFHLIASHSDSPTFKIKENPEISVENQYLKVNTEKYGGMIHSSWLDRPLSIAGRIVIEEDGMLQTKLVNVDKDLLVIPNLAIHMNGELNKGFEYNPQIDLAPLMGVMKKELSKGKVLEEVANATKVSKEQILGHDLYLYLREQGRVIGYEEELLMSPKLDDLECVYASLKGFLGEISEQYCNVLAIFDNEEVGSGTRQGADSTFLEDTLQRISESLKLSINAYCSLISKSFFISADNAHAVHPNRPEKADPTNRQIGRAHV